MLQLATATLLILGTVLSHDAVKLYELFSLSLQRSHAEFSSFLQQLLLPVMPRNENNLSLKITNAFSVNPKTFNCHRKCLTNFQLTLMLLLYHYYTSTLYFSINITLHNCSMVHTLVSLFLKCIIRFII